MSWGGKVETHRTRPCHVPRCTNFLTNLRPLFKTDALATETETPSLTCFYSWRKVVGDLSLGMESNRFRAYIEFAISN
ncbi:hypothetical protein QQP08_022261 [Theobroma cacao]|nr:hypothetical protein QQP08_022261 [Theobroma cacao]